MKIITLLALSLGLAHAQAQMPTITATEPQKVGIGILDIFDDVTHLNYNQLFKKILLENPILLDGKPLKVDLVEHPSQAVVAINAKMLGNALVAAVYKDGQLVARDTISVPDLETKKTITTIPFSIASSAKGYVIDSLAKKSKEYRQGLRNGHILEAIEYNKHHITAPSSVLDVSTYKEYINFTGDTKFVDSLRTGSTAFKINLLLDGIKSAKSIKAVNPLKRKIKSIKISKKTEEVPDNWIRPITSEQLSEVIQVAWSFLQKNQKKLAVTFKNSKLNIKSIDLIKPEFDDKKSKAQEQISISSTSELHYLEPGILLDSIFERENFYVPRKSSKDMQTGDAALNVMRYYNFVQKPSHLMLNINISTEVRGAVFRLSGPFYSKAGVFANYYIGAKQYETAKNYRAALNQYYASLRKVDDIIAGEQTKAKAKKAVLGHIAYCANELGQQEYAELIELAYDCVEMTIESNELRAANTNFYDFSEKVHGLCTEIESKLKKQRSGKAFALIGSIASAGLGVAATGLDANLALSLLANSADMLSENSRLNMELDAALYETTSSMTFNLPAELLQDESSPYEILASRYIAYALEHNDNKTQVLNRIAQYADNKPNLKQVVEQTKQEYELAPDKLDHEALIRQLSKTEVIIFRYEKRGLKVPVDVVP